MLCRLLGAGLVGYWAVAILIVVGKFWSARLNVWTRYGKLQQDDRELTLSLSSWPQWSLSHACTFRSFYLLGSVWNAVLVWYAGRWSAEAVPVSVTAAKGDCADAYRTAAVLFQVHVLRRLFESYYVQVFTCRQTPLILGLAGASFYIAVPTLWAWGQRCCCTSGLLRADLQQQAQRGVRGGWRLAVIALFLFASLAQYWTHDELARVRRPRKRRRCEKSSADHSATAPTYAVIRRGAFAWSTCPHYVAEMLIYTALAGMIATGDCARHCLVLPLLILLFVVTNLGHTARESKRWLQQRYPHDGFVRKRAALLPGLF